MEEKILEIMNENSSDANNGQMSVVTEDSYSDVADEIADNFRKFTEWLLSVRDMQTRMSIDKLFIYWWNNFKDK